MIKKLKNLFQLEASSGVLLFLSALASLIIYNSDFRNLFINFVDYSINLPFIKVDISNHHFINDFLMVLFFLFIGLELKQELSNGELSKKSQILLPLIAAIGGVVVPILIFFILNYKISQNLPAFAVPSATDIAFAYAILCFFKNKISKSLKIFLISLAIFDDIFAITIIAFFYSHDTSLIFLFLSLLVVMTCLYLNSKKIDNLYIYCFFGIMLFIFISYSGIHTTISGVILGLLIPTHKTHRFASKIAPFVNFFILPIFAFTNSAIDLNNINISLFKDELFLGILLGLFFGKQIGILLFSYILIKFKFAKLPKSEDAKIINNRNDWLKFYGVSILAGIGFTMSTFIATLAFQYNPILLEKAKIAILIGSLLAIIYGISIIYLSLKAKD